MGLIAETLDGLAITEEGLRCIQPGKSNLRSPTPPREERAYQERDRQRLQRRLPRPAAEGVQWHPGLLNRIYRLVDALAGRSKGPRDLIGGRSDGFDRFAGRTKPRVHRVQSIHELTHHAFLNALTDFENRPSGLGHL
jgi:hypothetical protein